MGTNCNSSLVKILLHLSKIKWLPKNAYILKEEEDFSSRRCNGVCVHPAARKESDSDQGN